MNGYTKLFGSIIASTIWREKTETKVVWITMLAMANKHGIVEASVPGLADMARVTVTEAQTALEIFSAPDTFSRTKDFEGRRIEAVDGGWVILNHAKYRSKMSLDERREYNRLKQQEFRERQKRAASKPCQQTSITVNHGDSLSAMSAHAEADTDSYSPPRAGVQGGRVLSDGEKREANWPLPKSIDTPANRAAWAKWIDYWPTRNGPEKARPMSTHTAHEHLTLLVSFGAENVVDAIAFAIGNSWASPAMRNGRAAPAPEKPRRMENLPPLPA